MISGNTVGNESMIAAPEDAGKATGRPLQTGQFHKTVALWLIVIGMAFFFIPLNLIATTVREDASQLEADLRLLRVSLTRQPTPRQEVQAALGTLTTVRQQKSSLEAIYPTLAAPRPNWSAVMGAVAQYNPDHMEIKSLTFGDGRITLSGRAVREDVVLAYAQALGQSNQFSRVSVQSMQLVADAVVTPSAIVATISPTIYSTATSTREASPTPAATNTLPPTVTNTPMPTTANTPPPIVTNTPMPTATNTSRPTATNTPTATNMPSPTFTRTATPDLRDQFEPDDLQAKPIFIGQPQSHNFYPGGDVDQVSFLAKAGRYYHVYTTELALGVDTVLTARVGSLTLTNDDSKPGTLASDILFQNTGADVTALITVTNRGEYGPDKRYKLVVEEIVPTPTSTRNPSLNINLPSTKLTTTTKLISHQSPDDVQTIFFDSDQRPAPGLPPQIRDKPDATGSGSFSFVIILDLLANSP